MPVDGNLLSDKQEKSLQIKTMISTKNNPWHNLLVRKTDYNPPTYATKQKDTKRSKKLFVDMLEGEYAYKQRIQQCPTSIFILLYHLFHVLIPLPSWNQDSKSLS